VLFDIFSDVRECLALITSRRIDGILVDWAVDDAALQQLAASGLPLVLLGRDAGELPLNWVKADEAGGAYEATRHLVALGHRRIGLLTGGADGHPIADERIRGYRRALAEAGIAPDPRHVAHGDWTFESGYRCGQRLLSRQPRPTALFVLSEIMVAGVLKAARRMGVYVPDDLAIVTTEDSAWVEYVWPELTAVHVPMDELGARATEMLLALLDGPARPPERVVMPTRFVVRESSAPARTLQAGLHAVSS
jgi:DNA-binding LacI/PurR family transcriptional regulator